jgi:hypothetical protein
MNKKELAEIDFDAEFFDHPDYKHRKNYRFEDLSAEDANNPRGRGRETAAPRGYDFERLISKINDGTRVSAPWFDVQWGTYTHRHCLSECKVCISEYDNGQTGRFRLWQKHHEKLLGAPNHYPNTFARYSFVIYTICEGRLREIGKIRVPPVIIESLVDNWHQEHHDTMGLEYTTQLSWTHLVSALDLDIGAFRRNEVVIATIESDQIDRLQSQVDYDTFLNNPFEDIDDPYRVCGPSCDIQH